MAGGSSNAANVTLADYTGGQVVLGTSYSDPFQGSFSGKLNIQNLSGRGVVWPNSSPLNILDGSLIEGNNGAISVGYGSRPVDSRSHERSDSFFGQQRLQS